MHILINAKSPQRAVSVELDRSTLENSFVFSHYISQTEFRYSDAQLSLQSTHNVALKHGLK